VAAKGSEIVKATADGSCSASEPTVLAALSLGLRSRQPKAFCPAGSLLYEICSEKARVRTVPERSATRARTVNVPFRAGTPDSRPVDARRSPGGSDPPTRVQRYGTEPPVAFRSTL